MISFKNGLIFLIFFLSDSAFLSPLLLFEKYLKTKTKSKNGKINTNVQNKKIPRKGSQSACLSVVLIYSLYRKGKKILSSRAFKIMEICCSRKKGALSLLLATFRNLEIYLEISSDDFDRENCNEENSYKEN